MSAKKQTKNIKKKCQNVLYSADNALINISWIFSLLSLAARIISDDTTIFTQKWKESHFNIKKCLKCKWINKYYVYRFYFRFADIISRVCVLSILWVAINGYAVIILLLIDLHIVLYIAHREKRLIYKQFCFLCVFGVHFVTVSFCMTLCKAFNL